MDFQDLYFQIILFISALTTFLEDVKLGAVDQAFRPLTNNEEATVNKLLSIPFLGRDELLAQLTELKAVLLDAEGSLQFKVSSGKRAPIDRGPAVELRYPDLDSENEDNAHINVLLHIKEGKLSMLEIYKDDGTKILNSIVPEKFYIFSI